MAQEYRFDAFISYRHMEPDSFAAKTLHKRLESFRLPRNIARRKRKEDAEAKTRITRVFRDQEELPLVSNLADPIMEALARTEYLIVICSPRLRESMWCKKEIETFISLHDREHVLAVLVEGEPDESFPEELLYKEVEKQGADGRMIKEKVPVEPLAADVRGGTPAQMKKKIKAEVLRLAAAMFACNYDDLKQRHKEQRMRRILAASTLVSAVCLSFGIVATAMALRIHNQNLRITAQSEEISAQSEEISRQADEISAQYAEALRNNCISGAGTAFKLLEDGDRIGALETALSVFPGEGREELPYTPQAAYALSESLHIYTNGSRILPDRQLESDTNISFMKLSPEGSRILTVDDSGIVSIWLAEDGSRLDRFLLTGWLNDDEEKFAFLNDTCFFYPTKEGIALYDSEKHADIYKVDCGGYIRIALDENNEKMLIEGYHDCYIMQADTGEILYSVSYGEQYSDSCKNSAFCGNNMFALAISNEKEELLIYDTGSGEMIRSYPLSGGLISGIQYLDGVVYVLENRDTSEGVSVFDTSGLTASVHAIDPKKEGILWTYEASGRWMNKVSASTKEGSNYLACSTYDTCVILDRTDGNLIDIFNLNSQIVKLSNYVGRDTFLVFTRDGVWHYLNLEIMTDMVGTVFPACTSNNVKAFEIGDGYVVTLPYSDRRVTIYRSSIGNGLETFKETEGRYTKGFIDQIGRYLAVSGESPSGEGKEYNEIYLEMYDTESGELLWSQYITEYGYMVGMSFYPERNAFVLTAATAFLLFDQDTGEALAENVLPDERKFEYNGYDGSYFITDETGRYLFAQDRDGVIGYDLEESSMVYWIPLDEISDDSICAVNPLMDYCVLTDSDTGSLRLYHLSDWRIREGMGEEPDAEPDATAAAAERKQNCLAEIGDINTAYIDALFFGNTPAEGTELYVVYHNGDIEVFTVSADGTAEKDSRPVRAYQDLQNILNHYIHPDGKDYAVAAGNYNAYMLAHGQITAYIEGFLALDGANDLLYLTDHNRIYRVPVYDAAALEAEAAAELGIR